MLNPSRIALLALLAGLAACGNDADSAAATAEPAEAAPASTEAPAAEAAPAVPTNPDSLANKEMVLGNEDAAVEVIEYASVTCPGCAYFHANIYPTLKEEFIDTGKVKFVYREFPTGPVQLSYAGSMLARCAAEKRGDAKAYFAFNTTLFENQRQWISENAQAELGKYAAAAGMSDDELNNCIARQDILDTINNNVETGRAAGVSATPTIMIGGEKFDFKDADDFREKLQAKIDAAG